MLDQAAPNLETVIANHIAPDARKVDKDGYYPEQNLRRLGQAGAFSHHTGDTPRMADAIAATAKISAACLSTGFATWCQNALALYLDRSPNRDLHRQWGAQVAQGRILGGTGLSNPMKSFSGIENLALRGEITQGGYRIKGRLPWVSNIAPGHLFAVIFSVIDHPPVMALISTDAPGVNLHEATRFIALDGTATHTVSFRDVFVPDENIIAPNAGDFIPNIRQSFVALQLGLAFGLSEGALKAMETDKKGLDLARYVQPTPAVYRSRLEALQERTDALLLSLNDPSKTAFHQMLRLRRDAATLTLDIMRSATIQAGSRGYIVGTAIERQNREAQFIAILTPSIKHIAQELEIPH